MRATTSAFLRGCLILVGLGLAPRLLLAEDLSFPAQTLSESLRELGNQTKTNMLFDPELTEKVHAPAVYGASGVAAALKSLLTGSGLTFRFIDERTVTVIPEKDAQVNKRTASKGAPGDIRLAQVDAASSNGALDNADASNDNSSNSTTSIESGFNLEEIIVTARRKEEKIQSVPIAITAVSQQTLQDNNIATIGDLQRLVPSMTANSSLFNRDSANVSIRGQGSNRHGGEPGVVAYLNEVPIPARHAFWPKLRRRCTAFANRTPRG